MSTLTKEYQRIGVGASGNFNGVTGYLELYAKYNGDQDIPNNKTNVTVRLDLVVSGGYIGNYQTTPWSISGSLSSSGDIGSGSHYSQTLGYATGDITHNADGTKSVSFSGSFNATAWGIVLSVSGSADLPTIPRYATLTDAPNFNDLDNPEITYSNPAGSSITYLQACICDTSGQVIYAPYRDISKTETSYTFELTETERNNLRSACTGDSMDVRLAIKSSFGDGWDYSSLDKTFTVVNGVYVKDDTWKKAIPYIKVNGSWKEAIPYIKVNGSWKKSRF